MTETRAARTVLRGRDCRDRTEQRIAASQRTHWSCSLRKIAKRWAGRRRTSRPAGAQWHLRINQLHHAQASASSWKTLANHKSNAKAALFWFQGTRACRRAASHWSPRWRKLRGRLKDRSRLAKLSGLIRYCSLKAIVPDAVDDAVIDGYMAFRKETTALAVDNKARRAIARAWNASRSIEGWPQQELIEPPLKAKAGPRGRISRKDCATTLMPI